jgi:hypothetical protein
LLHAALVELSHDYALKEGEIMRVIKPPFLKARSIAIQDNYGVSAEAAERVRHVSFLWRNGVAIPGAWSDQDADLDFICRAFVDLPWYRLDADAKYPALHGDLIVREDATPEQKLQALTSLIEKETNSRIELMHKKVTRASIVLHGKTDVPGYSFVDNMQLNMAGVGGYAVFITAKPLDDAALSHRAKRLMLFGSFGRPDDTSKMSLEGASFQLGAPFVVDANQDGQFRRTNLFLIGDDVGLWRTGDPGYAENLTRVVANLKKQLGGDWRIEQRDFDVLSLRDAAE